MRTYHIFLLLIIATLTILYGDHVSRFIHYDCVFNALNWSLMNDLNVRPSGPKPDALPD